MFITENPFYYFSHCLLCGLSVSILLQAYENIPWDVTAWKLTKRALLPNKDYDYSMVYAGASHVFPLVMPTHKLHKIFSGIWCDKDYPQP